MDGTDEALLAELPGLADTIEKANAAAAEAHERRDAIWQELVARGHDRGVVASLSRVGRSAVGVALHKRRKAAVG